MNRLNRLILRKPSFLKVLILFLATCAAIAGMSVLNSSFQDATSGYDFIDQQFSHHQGKNF